MRLQIWFLILFFLGSLQASAASFSFYPLSSSNYPLLLNLSASTTLTVPTSGTLATTAGNASLSATGYIQVDNTFKMVPDTGLHFSVGDPIIYFKPGSGINFLGYYSANQKYFFVANDVGLLYIGSASMNLFNIDLTVDTDNVSSIGSALKRFKKVWTRALDVVDDTTFGEDADGYVQIVRNIPTHTGHGIILRDTNGSIGRAPKVQFESVNKVWQVLGNNIETGTHSGKPDTVDDDFAITEATDADGMGYRFAIEGDTGDVVINPGQGTRDGLRDGVIKAGDHRANNADPGRTLMLRAGDATAGTGAGGDLLVRGGTSAGGQRGDFFIPSVAGAPSDTPHSHSGFAPARYDTTNHKLCVYDSGWKCSAAFTAP